LVSPEAEWWVSLCSCLGISVGTQLPHKLERVATVFCRKRFSLAQAFTPGWETAIVLKPH